MTPPICPIHKTENKVDDGAFFCLECDEDGLLEITITVCRPCRQGTGVECHTPGCTFWMWEAPSRRIAERLTAVALEAYAVEATGDAG